MLSTSNTYTPSACLFRIPAPALTHSSFHHETRHSAYGKWRGYHPWSWVAARRACLLFGVLHAAFDARPYHRQFRLRKYANRLKERLTHGVGLPVPAVDGDASHDDQPQMPFAYNFYQFAQLLCASGKSADFQRDNGVAFLGDRRPFDARSHSYAGIDTSKAFGVGIHGIPERKISSDDI